MAVVLVGAACSSGKKAAKAPATTTTTSTTTTSTTTTTAPPVLTGPPAPLTGLPSDAAQPLLLLRPALAVKLDNSAEAMPQEGLNAADVVFEIKVEGISRLMAVFHSHDAREIGPTRSARYSDPNVLALLGKPLFAWSGANDGVTGAVNKVPWIVNVNWDRNPNDYYRRNNRPAPHNLYTRTPVLFGRAQPGQPPARALFAYTGPGQANTLPAVPIAGIDLSVGDTGSSWVWDAASASWLRWQYGRRHNDEAGGQVSAANVVILQIRYSGGSQTPTAVTLGSGRAIVMSNGAMIEGTWSRPAIAAPLTLKGADGQPLLLTPGRTWVELTPGATSRVMTAESAAGLLRSAQ